MAKSLAGVFGAAIGQGFIIVRPKTGGGSRNCRRALSTRNSPDLKRWGREGGGATAAYTEPPLHDQSVEARALVFL